MVTQVYKECIYHEWNSLGVEGGVHPPLTSKCDSIVGPQLGLRPPNRLLMQHELWTLLT